MYTNWPIGTFAKRIGGTGSRNSNAPAGDAVNPPQPRGIARSRLKKV